MREKAQHDSPAKRDLDTSIPGTVWSGLQAPSRTIRPERAALSSWEVNVEIATSQLPRIVRLALIGAATAFAWIVVSLLLGLGLGQAHADETDDGGLLGGALGGVTSVVDTTASTVTETVSSVTTGVPEALDPVVAVAPAPVQQPVNQVVQTVGTAVATVTQPVSDVASGGVVGGIAQPVVDIVTDVPVVGDVVTGVGLDDAVADLGGTVDDALGDLTGAVGETGQTIDEPPAGVIPSIPDLPLIPGSGPSDDSATPALGTGLAGLALVETTGAFVTQFATAAAIRAAWGAASVALTAVTDGVVFVSSAVLAAGGAFTSSGGLCLPSASAGPGGAGPGAWALIALVPLAAHRAWVRRAGPEDELAPPAPTGSTDVSPD